MKLKLFLAKTKRLLERNAYSQATDLLTEFLFDQHGSPTGLNLPNLRTATSPEEAVHLLEKALTQNGSGSRRLNDCLVADDLDLIEASATAIEERQRSYQLDEENEAPLQKNPSDPNNDLLLDEVDSVDDLTLDSGELPHSEEVEGEPTSLTTDSADDFPWEDLPEGFDELEEQRTWEDVDHETPLTRDERAYQEALKLGRKHGWYDWEVDLLAEVFTLNGYGQSRVAMDSLIGLGMTPEELFLANELKKLWADRIDFAMAFYYRRRDISDATYSGRKNISWRMALHFVRTFPGVVDFVEIEHFVEEAFQDWFESTQLRANFRAFWDYLDHLADLAPSEDPIYGGGWLNVENLDALSAFDDEKISYHGSTTWKLERMGYSIYGGN